MKILLINPPRIYYQGSKGLRFGLPLGLLYIAAVLEKYGYQPKILDCLISSKSEIVRIELTVEVSSGKFTKEISFTTAAVLRGAY